MGVDIAGAIECLAPWWRTPAERSWQFALDLELLYDNRHYDAFGCLFGVRNHAGFRPVASDRGFPDDAAPATRHAYEELRADYPHWTEAEHHPTWLTWHDVATIDWDEQAERPDERITVYRRTPDGTLVREYKALRSAEFAELAEHPTAGPLEGVTVSHPRTTATPLPAAAREWQRGDKLYRAELARRSDAITANDRWHDVFGVMRILAGQHGDEGVRLVVWFDG